MHSRDREMQAAPVRAFGLVFPRPATREGIMLDVCNRLAPYVLSIVRIMTALLLLQHGLSKFFGFPMPMRAPPMFSLFWYAGMIEIVGGVLLLIGLLTRPVAFILSGHLAFAYFMGHAGQSF